MKNYHSLPISGKIHHEPLSEHRNTQHQITSILIWLVVLTILKHMKVNGKDYPIYHGQ